MKKLLIIIVAVVFHCQAFAAQQNLNYSTRSSWATEASKVQANTTELYTTKANKASTVMLWSEWADGSSFTTSSPIVQYGVKLYKCIAPYTKVSGETPDTQTTYFSELAITGGNSAADVTVSDAGGYYTATNVETVLQEIGAWPALTVETTPTTGDNKVPASSYVLGFDSDADGKVDKLDLSTAGVVKTDSSGVVSSGPQIYVLDDCTTATGMATGDLCFEY